MLGEIIFYSCAVYYTVCCSLICSTLCREELERRRTLRIEYENLPRPPLRMEIMETIYEEDEVHQTELERQLFNSYNGPMRTLNDVI